MENHINLKSNVPLVELPEWFQNAKTLNAIIEYYNKVLVWKSGTWEYGLWEYGLWESGTWKSGTWKSGTWKSGIWESGTWESGIWKSGTWKDGIWEYGIWESGIWESGIWEYGLWESGTWESGTWKDGIWESGTWKDGIWEDGFKTIGQCKWKVYYSKTNVKIGCKTKTVEEWDQFFNGIEEYSTKRNTEQFTNIHNSFLLAKMAIKLNI